MFRPTALIGEPLTFPPPTMRSPAAKTPSVRCALAACGPESNRNSSFYEILKVNRTASVTEIKNAYRSLAKLFHPDVAAAGDSAPGGQDFIAIHDAYVTLSDPASRASYDVSLGARRSRRFRFCACPTRRWETDQCW